MSLKIQPNSRQMPKDKKTMNDKNYYDILYAWFQCHSGYADEYRTVPYAEVVFKTMSEELDINRKTISKYVKQLVTLKMLVPDDKNKRYILPELERHNATLIPNATLKSLIINVKRDTVNLFIYLLNRYMAGGECEFIVTYKELKQAIGVCATTQSNDEVIKERLKFLQALGLLDFTTVRLDNSKTVTKILSMNNVLPNMKPE